MGFFGSVTAGLGVLIALDRESRRGDIAACGLLVVSLTFSSIGIAFVAASLVDLALGRRPRRNRAYVALLPLTLYGLWWLGWGHSAGSNVSLENLEQLPRYLLDAGGAGLMSLLGREPGAAGGHAPVLGQVLLLVLLAATALRIYRERTISRRLAIALTLALVFWALTGLDREAGRYAISSRYQYPSAVFLLLIAAELLQGVRPPRPAVAAVAVLVAAAVFGGVSLLRHDYENTWRPLGEEVRAMLAGVEIAGNSARPGYQVRFPPGVAVPVDSYLALRREHGSPAFSTAALPTHTDNLRRQADTTLAAALGLNLEQVRPGLREQYCQVRSALDSPARLQPGDRITLTAIEGADVRLHLGRFADGFPVVLGRLPTGQTRALEIPTDSSRRPWQLIVGAGQVRLCR